MTRQLSISQRREVPWLGIGTSGLWTDYREALADSQLDFLVEPKDAKVEIQTTFPGNGTLPPVFSVGIMNPVHYETVPGIQVNLRQSDNKILGCVSSQYGIIQNQEAFKLLEPFTQIGGKITNAGMTEQGLVFMVLRLRQENILGDDWNIDVMCTNSFNGMFPCALMIVPTRIICQNMYRSLMGGGADSVLRIRHGGLAQQRLDAAQVVTGGIMSYISAFGATLEKARANKISSSEVEGRVLPILFPYPKPGGEREQMSRERVDALRQEFMDVYYDATDNRKFHGTGMGFINAYYDYLSHRNPTKCMPGSWFDRRLSGLVSGNDVKVSAIKAVM